MPIEAIALKDFSISEIGDCALTASTHSVSSWPHLSQRSSSMASEPPPHDAEYAAAQLAQIRKYGEDGGGRAVRKLRKAGAHEITFARAKLPWAAEKVSPCLPSRS